MSTQRPVLAALIDELPPTQYLIMEVLAARYRCGEDGWTFPSSLRNAVEQLASLQLVSWKEGVVPRSVIVWFRDDARDGVLMPGYEPAAVRKQRERAESAEAMLALVRGAS